MDRWLRSLGLAAVLAAVALAGCTGLAGDVGAGDVPALDGPGSALGDGGPANPWGQAVVPVTVNDTLRNGQNTTALVERAIAYWTANRDRYTDWSYRFRPTDDPSAARVEVRIVERIDECAGPSTNAAGCAPLLTEGDRAGDREVVRIVGNRSNAAVTTTAKHEFGHLLGLDHGAEPRWLMANGSQGPVRNASDRTNPWMTDELTVAVEPEAMPGDPARVRERVDRAVEYYDRGANGTVPSNVSFARTEHVRSADVIVTNDAGRGCRIDGGSIASYRGSNRDRDSKVETYSRVIVCVGVDREDVVGWHVGHWLGRAMGLEPSELAAPFRTTASRDQREEWWT